MGNSTLKLRLTWRAAEHKRGAEAQSGMGKLLRAALASVPA